jgi:hypothetical protein
MWEAKAMRVRVRRARSVSIATKLVRLYFILFLFCFSLFPPSLTDDLWTDCNDGHIQVIGQMRVPRRMMALPALLGLALLLLQGLEEPAEARPLDGLGKEALERRLGLLQDAKRTPHWTLLMIINPHPSDFFFFWYHYYVPIFFSLIALCLVQLHHNCCAIIKREAVFLIPFFNLGGIVLCNLKLYTPPPQTKHKWMGEGACYWSMFFYKGLIVCVCVCW